MPSDEYLAYLRSPHWREVRARYQRSKLPWRCYICNATGRLDLHHKTYKRFGRERLHDLIPLCRPCHDAVHLAVRDGTSLWTATKKVKRSGKIVRLPDDTRLGPEASRARATKKRRRAGVKKPVAPRPVPTAAAKRARAKKAGLVDANADLRSTLERNQIRRERLGDKQSWGRAS